MLKTNTARRRISIARNMFYTTDLLQGVIQYIGYQQIPAKRKITVERPNR